MATVALMLLAGICLLPGVELGSRRLSHTEMNECYDNPSPWTFLGTDCFKWECSTEFMGETLVPPDASLSLHMLSRDPFILPCSCSLYVNWYGWAFAANKLNFTVDNERLSNVYHKKVQTSSSYGYADFVGPHYHFWSDEKLERMYWKFYNILSLGIADEKVNGNYTCGGWGEPDAVVISMNFYDDLPTIVKTVTEDDFGDPIEMECVNVEQLEADLTYIIPPVFNWGTPPSEEWNNLFSDDSSYTYEDEKKMFTVNELKRSNLGSYICSITSEDNQTVRARQIYEIQAKPWLLESSNTISYQSNFSQDLNLTYPVDGYPKPQVEWTLSDGETLTVVPVKSSQILERFNGISGGVLRLTNMDKRDHGTYTVKCLNMKCPKYKIKVTMKSGPYFSSPNRRNETTSEFSIGEDVHLHCLIDAMPPPTFEWYKGSQLLSSSGTVTIDGSSLNITNSALTDQALYKCVGSNPEGPSVTYMITLQGKYEPVLTTSNSSTIVQIVIGANKTLVCPIDSYPEATVTWYKDDKIVFITDGPELHFQSCLGTDAGSYKCVAKNEIGPNNVSHVIDAQVGPWFPLGSNKGETGFDVGNAVTMYCDIDSYPKPTLEWYQDGDELLDTDAGLVFKSYNDVERAALTLKNPKLEDEDSYECVATNVVQGATATFTIELIKKYAPYLTKPTNEIIGFSVGDSFSLYCQIDGFPRPDIKWFKGKKMINNGDDSRIVIETYNGTKGGALTFTGAVGQDKARYVCKGGNEVEPTPVAYTIELIGDYGPVITTTIHTPHLQLVGVTMMYTCPIDGVPEPTFTWYKNRTKIPTDARTSFPGRAIKIVNFAKEDRDEYTCMGENNIEPFNASYTVEIIAQYGPVVLVPNNATEATVNIGSNQTLHCPIDGYPLPVFTWYKNGVEMSYDDDRVVFKTVDGKVNGAISFNPCELMDIGLYKCVGENEIPPQTASHFIQFQYGPVINDTSNETEIGFDVGQSVTLSCPILAYPQASIKWYKNGEVISNENWAVIDSTDEGKITITGLQKKDAYLFVCVGNNGKAPYNVSYGFHLMENFGPLNTNATNLPNVTRRTDAIDFGDVFEMYCPIDGFPRPKVEWYQNDVKLSNDTGYILKRKNIEAGKLLIRNMSLELTGVYECRFKDVTYSRKAVYIKYISLDGPDHFEVIFDVGDNVTFMCPGVGYPELEFYFMKFDYKEDDFVDYLKSVSDEGDRIQYNFVSRYHTIINSRETDSGDYMCKTKNSMNAFGLRSFFSLHARYGPRIASKTIHMTITYYSSNLVKLHCPMESYPRPVVSWYDKHGSPISRLDESINIENNNFTQDGTLVFTYIQKKDAGLYKCVGRNNIRPYNASYTYDLVETYAPRCDDPTKATMVTLRVGEKITLDCPIYAYPKPVITWYKDRDKEVTNHDHNVIIQSFNDLEDAAMTLISASMADVGDYMCVGENDVPPLVANHVFHLRADYGPFLTRTETTIGFTVGDPIEIRCEIVSNPKPTITWFTHQIRHGPNFTKVQIPNDSARFSLKSEDGIKNNVVKIVRTKRTDVGFYSCKGVSKMEPYTAWFMIKLVEKFAPIVLRVGEKTTVGFTVGDKLKVECPMDGNPKPLVKWFKDGNRLNRDHRIIITNTNYLYSGSLEFRRIRKEDEGSYECVAENEIEPYTGSFTIEIIEKFGPVVININQEHSIDIPELANLPEGQIANRSRIEYRADEDLTVLCAIDALPKPKVTWYKNGEIFPSPQGNISMEIANGIQNGALKFTPSAKKDAGFYRCIGTNELNPFTASFTMELRETFPPVVVIGDSKTRIPFTYGESVTLVCPIDSYPKPMVKWYKDGELLTGDKSRSIMNIGSYEGVMLKIHRIENNSVYECVAENTVRSKLHKTTYTMNLVDKDIIPPPPFGSLAIELFAYMAVTTLVAIGITYGIHYARLHDVFRNLHNTNTRSSRNQPPWRHSSEI